MPLGETSLQAYHPRLGTSYLQTPLAKKTPKEQIDSPSIANWIKTHRHAGQGAKEQNRSLTQGVGTYSTKPTVSNPFNSLAKDKL